MHETGRYEGIPFADYLEIDAGSNSRYTDLKRSRAYCRYRIDHPESTSTPAMDLGTAWHTGMLEPHLFDAKIAPRPEGNGNSKAFKAERDRLLADGFTIIKPEDREAILRVRDRLHTDPSEIRDVLTEISATEVTYIAPLHTNATPTKVRVDFELGAVRIVGELKTTADASPDAFGRQVYNLGYHRAKALYMDVANSVELELFRSHIFLVIQNTEPFEARLYELDEQSTSIGRREVRDLAMRYDACVKADDWTDPPAIIEPLALTGWATAREES